MKFFFILFTVCFSMTLVSQNQMNETDVEGFSYKQFSFQTLTVDDGLSQNSVISIAQDSIGYLWLATQDGLNRYDGRNFKFYNKQFEDVTRPTYSRLGKIYFDKENNMWIITQSGKLEKYNRTNDTFKSIKKFKAVSSIFQDSENNHYIGTINEGLYKIDPTKQDTTQIFSNTETNSISDIIEYKHTIYVAATNGLYKYGDGQNSSKAFTSVINVSSLAKLNDDRLFIGTYGNGLYYLDNGSEKPIQITELKGDSIPENLNIQDLMVDKTGRLWVATYGNGVYLLDFEKESIKQFTAHKYVSQSISYNDVLSLYQDFTGTIWLGTDGGGVSYYDEHLFKFNVLTNNQVPENIKINVIRSITVDQKNNIWVGTSGEGLSCINEDKDHFKTLTTNNSQLLSNRIMSLLSAEEEIWIGHQGSGLQIMKKSGKFLNFDLNTSPSLSASTIWSIYKDSRDRIWLATRNNGLIQFDKTKGVQAQYTYASGKGNSLISNNIRTVVEGKNQELFIGADDGGLCKLNPHTGEIINIPSIDDSIKSLYFDGQETLWIGTNGNGLKSYNINNGNIKAYTINNGLANNVIYGILADEKSNLWLSSNRGISMLDLSTDEIINYSNYDGLQALEFNTGAYFKNADKTLYFGGIEGLNWFRPDQITLNESKPKTILSKFEVFSEEKPLTNNLALNYQDNTVTFSFSGLHFSQPDRNQYKYKLENHDEDWIEAGNTNSAHYTNLPPDEYQFKVISSNYDGVWNERPTSFKFRIDQPWYLSTLAICMYIIFLFLGIYLIYKYFKWRWHMNMKLKVEHTESERLKKLNDFKTILYTNISHEFRTPLTLISGPVEQQLERENLTAGDKKDLTMIRDSSDRLLNLVDQLLDLSKLESGNLKLSVAQGNLTMILNQLVGAFQYKANSKNIDLKYQIARLEKAWYNADIIEKIIMNLLANAIKYTPANGYIHFNAHNRDGQLIISILNNGNTLTDEDLSKLFRRYFQYNDHADGVGIGLSLVKELVVLNHGNIVVNSLNEDDIQFTVTLPIEKSFFAENEIVERRVESQQTHKRNSEKLNGSSMSELSDDQPILQIVEDNAEVRDYIKSIFNKGFKIIEAKDGKDGISMAIKFIPDLIISDIMMPNVNGIELCTTLKKDQHTCHIPIILLTAKSGEEHEIEGLEAGADAYITKPFSNKKLKLRVQKLIELRKTLQKRYSGDSGFDKISSNAIDIKFVKTLKESLKDNIKNPEFNSADLSNTMLMSRMQLHRKLKALTGKSTTEIIREERLRLALPLLRDGSFSISEIAYEVGFNTPSYFIRIFKKVYNSTPSEYIEKTT